MLRLSILIAFLSGISALAAAQMPGTTYGEMQSTLEAAQAGANRPGDESLSCEALERELVASAQLRVVARGLVPLTGRPQDLRAGSAFFARIKSKWLYSARRALQSEEDLQAQITCRQNERTRPRLSLNSLRAALPGASPLVPLALIIRPTAIRSCRARGVQEFCSNTQRFQPWKA